MNRILLVIVTIAMSVAAAGCATKQRKSQRLNPDSNPHSLTAHRAPESANPANPMVAPSDEGVDAMPGELATEELPAEPLEVEANGESPDSGKPEAGAPAASAKTTEEPVIDDPIYAAELERRKREAARRAAIEQAHRELTGGK